MKLRFENPVLTKELRTRMRGARAYAVLFVYLFVLSLILFFTYFAWWQNQQRMDAWGGQDAAFAVGKTFYATLFITQAVLVGLITPSLTAGGISIEREQRTYELLSVSLLPRRSIVLGKLFAAVGFVGLLLTSSLPLVSLCFLLGGVSPGEVLAAYSLLLVAAFLYGVVGVAWSAISRNTSTATVMAYGTILLLFFVTLPLAIMSINRPFGGPNFGVGLGAVNPVGAVVAGTLTERYFGLALPAWAPALLINGLLGVIFAVVAVHRLEYPLTDRSGLLRLLTALFVGLLAFFVYGCILPGAGMLQFADAQNRLGILAGVTVAALCVLVPVFATGDGLPPGGVFSALDPRRLSKGEAPSGSVYVLLLVALCALVLLLGISENLRPRVLPLLVVSGAVAFGLGAAGLLFSALLENRWGALALTLTATLLLYLVPLTGLMSYERGQPGSLTDNVLYLSPFLAVAQIGSPGGAGFWDSIPPLMGGRTPFAVVTSVIYVVLGVVCLAAAQAVYRSRRRRRERVPVPVPVPTT